MHWSDISHPLSMPLDEPAIPAHTRWRKMNINASLSSMGRRMQAPPISWLMSLTLERPQLISLAAGFTDNESLPVEPAREILNEILSDKATGQMALQYGTTAGLPELRRLTADRVRSLDCASSTEAYDPNAVVITNGSQQLLYLLTECLCDPGDIVILEDPTYFVYLGILQSQDIRCRGVRLTPQGLDLDQLDRVLSDLKKSGDLPRVKLFYTISYFQNPSGVTTSLENKRAILELLAKYESAAGHPIFYLEDAAYRELAFTNQTPPSTLSLAHYTDRVLYAGTYSKPFATGSRVGFGILPEPVRTCVLRAKGNHDFGTSNLLQALLHRALERGDYVNHLSQLRARYQAKSSIMRDALKTHFPEKVRWADATGGLYYWAALPNGASAGVKSKAFQSALDHNVLYVPGELCYADDPTRHKSHNEMRLSFGGATEQNIRDGIARLGAVLKDLV